MHYRYAPAFPLRTCMRSPHELALALCTTHWCLCLIVGLMHAPTGTVYSALVNFKCCAEQDLCICACIFRP